MRFSHKLHVLTCLLILATGCDQGDQVSYVEIPDQAFLEALSEQGVDTDGDGRISTMEAEGTLSLEIGPASIHDLTGIGAFVNLDSLTVFMNPLSVLDLSGNRKLRYLECRGCELSALGISENTELRTLDCSGDYALDNYLESLDISSNTMLEYLDCSGNQISAIDLSRHPSLTELYCGRNELPELDLTANTLLNRLACNNNHLTSLSLSHNTALTSMISCGNRLTSLDISANTSLVKIGIDNMPMLLEVCVWTLPFPPPGVVILMDYSPNVVFRTGCSR